MSSSSSSAAYMQSAKGFINFVNKSQSPWHAVQTSREKLLAAGFSEINERDSWQIQPNGKYFFSRNQSTLVAFAVGGNYKPGNGFSIVGAHTDSPCIRVKPVSVMPHKHGYIQVGIEPYGGGLWHTWFDRDLTVCGRAVVNCNGTYKSKLVKVDRPILSIPNLAIHLNRDIYTEGFKPNKQTQIVPILATAIKSELEKDYKPSEHACSEEKQEGMHHPVLIKLLCEELNCQPDQIVDFELCLADCVPSCISGANNEFIHSGRLDNLLSSYCALEGLVNALPSLSSESNVRIVTLYDHEEIGSSSAQGAASAMTEHVLRRLAVGGSQVAFEEAINKSMLISADMAHAVHPNYPEKHEPQHTVQIHKGPVLKYNTNQRYATNSVTASVLKELAKTTGVPLQSFVVRNDMGCGSTIGPILSSKLGLRVVDIGNPQLAMHSIREMCGTDDVHHAIKLFEAFFDSFAQMDAKLRIDG
eukprot:Nk52_evm61s485 gene=Nk52_evmTU61s485